MSAGASGRDTVALLSGVPFLKDEANDLAVCDPGLGWFAEHGIESVPAVMLDRDLSGHERSGFYLLMGYPATRNRFSARYGRTTRNLLSLSVDGTVPLQGEPPVAEPVAFACDPERVTDSTRRPAGLPALQGMSGGPALEVLARPVRPGEREFTLSLAGVLLAWRKRERQVVAARADAVLRLVDRLAALTR